MSLDAGRVRSQVVPGLENGNYQADNAVFKPWANWEPSHISHHARACCEIAREWIVHTDYSSLNGGNMYSGPRWLRHRFEWGPGKYPLYWCELIKKTKLDCGVLAALAHEAFSNRGVRCFRIQLVQEFNTSTTAQWRSAWEGDEAVTGWITDKLIYHEGCAIIVRDDELKLWDSSAGWWIDPKTTAGYGAPVAVRIASNRAEDFRWGKHMLKPGAWTALA